MLLIVGKERVATSSYSRSLIPNMDKVRLNAGIAEVLSGLDGSLL